MSYGSMGGDGQPQFQAQVMTRILFGETLAEAVEARAAERLALVGDTLFRGSVGLTDFPYGETETLLGGIASKLLPLGDDLTFVCGHGPPSTIGEERRNNPFLRGR